MLPTRHLRFRDLRERGIVGSWVTLGNWIKKQGFPPGRKFGPNSRVWTEAEVAEWCASRPSERKPDPRTPKPDITTPA